MAKVPSQCSFTFARLSAFDELAIPILDLSDKIPTEKKGKRQPHWRRTHLEEGATGEDLCTMEQSYLDSQDPRGYLLLPIWRKKFGMDGQREHRLASQKWMVHALCGYFHTDDYLSRIYVYERSTLYNFSFPSFFGEGIRYAMIAQVKVIPRLTFIVKLATTDYFDRNAIGSGLQQIDHSSQTDLTLQLKWRM